MKPKAKTYNFIIPLVIYPFDVMVSIGQTHEELDNSLKIYNCSMDDEDKETYDRDTVRGRAVMLPTNQSIIRLKKIPETPSDYGTLAHEIFHIASYIFDRIGIKLKILW